MSRVILAKPWLCFDLGQPMRLIGWPVVGPAIGIGQRVLWMQLAELAPDQDPETHFRSEAAKAGQAFDIGLMTAAEIDRHHYLLGPDLALVCTAGITNGESVFPAADAKSGTGNWHTGTINMALRIARPVTTGAMIEALSILAQARTAALMDLGLCLPDGRPLTGTGTDCIIVAAPEGEPSDSYCGLHTQIGRAIGALGFEAVRHIVVNDR